MLGGCARSQERLNAMDRLSYTDERIDEVRMGAPLTDAERADLLEHTPNFEECSHTREELAAMTDAELMTTAMWVWADYCR
jgi:hypothetical protein